MSAISTKKRKPIEYPTSDGKPIAETDRLRCYRLRKGEYEPIALVDGRMPSKELGLHLEPDGNTLRLFNPLTNAGLLTSDERAARAEHEVERLRKEIEKHLRRYGA